MSRSVICWIADKYSLEFVLNCNCAPSVAGLILHCLYIYLLEIKSQETNAIESSKKIAKEKKGQKKSCVRLGYSKQIRMLTLFI